jgi:hypothetical protein
MERFAKRHRQTLNELLGTDSGQSPSDSTLRLLLAQLVVTGLVTLLRNWMAAEPGMAIAQTTYATDASSEIQALGQLLEAVALEGVLVLCCSSNTSAIRSTKPATPRWWAQPAHGGLAGAKATSQQAAHRSSWLIRQQGLRGIESGNNHPNAQAGNQSETPFTRKAIYDLSQAAQQTRRLIVNLYYLRSKLVLLKHMSL